MRLSHHHSLRCWSVPHMLGFMLSLRMSCGSSQVAAKNLRHSMVLRLDLEKQILCWNARFCMCASTSICHLR